MTSTVTLTKQALDAGVTHSALVDALKYVASKLPRNANVAVLSGVLLETTYQGELVLSTFDYETCYRQTIRAEVGNVGRALIPAKFIADMVKGLDKNGTVHIQVRGAEAQITGDGTTYTVETLPIDDYPALPDGTGEAIASLDVGQLARAADVTLAAGKDDTLPVLTAVAFESIDGRLQLAATDRYRLSVFDTGRPFTGERVLVPATAVKLVASSFKGTTLITRSANGQYVTFTRPERSLSVRTVDGTFPQWQRLIPPPSQTSASVDAKTFTTAIAQVSKVAPGTTPIELTGSGPDLTLRSRSQTSKASKTIHAEVKHYGDEPVRIQFNPGYLADAIKGLNTTTVEISFASDDHAELARKPAVFSNGTPQFRTLLMPVRVS